jgi:hypothetical protein
VRPAISARLGAGFGIVAVGILVAVATNMALTVFSSAKLAFALGGLALLIPTMVVQAVPAGHVATLRHHQKSVIEHG